MLYAYFFKDGNVSGVIFHYAGKFKIILDISYGK
jgi:hypothetical protein